MGIQKTLLAILVAAIGFCSSRYVAADIVGSAESFGGTLLAISNDADQSAVVQTGSAVFGAPGQVFTDATQTNIGVTTSQQSLGGDDWELVLNFQTANGEAFIAEGSTIESTGDEINAWSIFIGDTAQSGNPLNLLGPVSYNSVVSQWKADGVVQSASDVLASFNGSPDSISGVASIGIEAGGNPNVYDELSDLGRFRIDELTLTFNVTVTAVPEPNSLFVTSIVVFGLGVRRKRSGSGKAR